MHVWLTSRFLRPPHPHPPHGGGGGAQQPPPIIGAGGIPVASTSQIAQIMSRTIEERSERMLFEADIGFFLMEFLEDFFL
jgi:hypothetical protein